MLVAVEQEKHHLGLGPFFGDVTQITILKAAAGTQGNFSSFHSFLILDAISISILIQILVFGNLGTPLLEADALTRS